MKCAVTAASSRCLLRVGYNHSYPTSANGIIFLRILVGRAKRFASVVLRNNNYSAEFIKSCESHRKAPRRVPSSDNASSERLHRSTLLHFRMSEESIRKLQGCCVLTMLKLASNHSTLCVHTSQDPRTGLPSKKKVRGIQDNCLDCDCV